MELNPVAVPIHEVPFQGTDQERHPLHCTCASKSSMDKYEWCNEYICPGHGGLKYWKPIVQDDVKPIVGTIFDSLDKGIEMYAKYARFGGFDIRRSKQKKAQDGSLILKRIVCTKEGKSYCKTQPRILRTECEACVCFKLVNGTSFMLSNFVEMHNHELDVGTRIDYKKFSWELRPNTEQSDAWSLIEKLEKKQKECPRFSFDYQVSEKGMLTHLFWADETSKRNYLAFGGDVVAFDATYSTNKYDMVFVSFTGMNNHRKRVTFGVGLIASETVESYIWLLQVFFKTFDTWSIWVQTDDHPLMKMAVTLVIGNSDHRFCLRHLMDKLPTKVCPDVLNNTNFRQRLDDIVWSDYSTSDEFKEKWSLLMDEFKMNDNKWLKDMFGWDTKWLPVYDWCSAGLLKAMSMLESINGFSQRYFHQDSTLNDLMKRFEFAMVCERKAQRDLDNETCLMIPEFKTSLRIEAHAHEVYTKAVFMDVQMEIYESMNSCLQTSTESSENGSKIFYIMDQKKPGNTLYKVVEKRDIYESTSCSCKYFLKTPCRHIFCVLRNNGIEEIPQQCIDRSWRWTKDALNKQPLKLTINRNGKNESSDEIINDIYTMFGHCISRIRKDVDKHLVFQNKVQEMMKQVLSGGLGNKEDDDDESDRLPTRICRNCGELAFHDSRNCPLKEKNEIDQCEEDDDIAESELPTRTCRNCGELAFHDSRNCPLKQHA